MIKLADRYNLISVSLRNFRGIEYADIDFTESGSPRNIMTVYGHQSSGKSTLILAIQWCAYGTDFNFIKNKLHQTRILPNHWNKQRKSEVSVIIRFRPMGEGFDPADDIYCKRVLSPESIKRDHIEVTIGNESHDEYSSQEYFSQIFGESPKVDEGVMWVIRRAEMLRMADTISPEKNSYFLDFMNLHVPYAGLTDLFNKYSDETDSIVGKNPKKVAVNSNGLRSEITRLESLLTSKKNEFEQEQILLRKSKPSQRDGMLANAREIYEKAERELELAETNLGEKKIRESELSEFVNVLLHSKMKKEGIEIIPSFASSDFKWDKIADFLETTKRIPPNYVKIIRNFETESGYNTTSLIEAGDPKVVSRWLLRISELKQANERHISALAVIRQHESNGITKETTKDAHLKVVKAQSLSEKCEKINNDIIHYQKQLTGHKKDLTNLEKKLAKVAENESKMKILSQKKTVASGLMRVIDETNNSYIKEMFKQTIERVKYYWDEIDQVGKYTPIMIHDPVPQFALKNVQNGAILPIQIEDMEGDGSGGETQLLLVCTCLAVSESSGAKMPIILDDCFTDVDKETRQQLVKTVAEHFGSLIFVTNDEDKAKLLDSTQGTLSLNWPKKFVTINRNNFKMWSNWE